MENEQRVGGAWLWERWMVYSPSREKQKQCMKSGRLKVGLGTKTDQHLRLGLGDVAIQLVNGLAFCLCPAAEALDHPLGKQEG